jgi:uncharacterized protein (DUF362 family)
MSATIALVSGDDRRANLARALELIAPEIDLRGRRSVLVKPNLVAPGRPLANTHPDAVIAILELIRARYDGRLLVAEGSATAPTAAGFTALAEAARRYEAELVDLNADEVVPVQVYDRRLRPRVLRLARSVVESDFRVSVGPPKTHDTVIVTLSLKNMIMGSLVNRALAGPSTSPGPLRRARRLARGLVRRLGLGAVAPTWLAAELGVESDKVAMHQGYPTINLNLAMLAPWVQPHLAVIDGYTAMEGAGPVAGDPVEWRVALASCNALALDRFTAGLMGFDPEEVGYLAMARRLGLGGAEPDDVRLLGDTAPDAVRRRFRPHPTYAAQRRWRTLAADERLRPAALAVRG